MRGEWRSHEPRRHRKTSEKRDCTGFIQRFGCYFDRSHHSHFDTYTHFWIWNSSVKLFFVRGAMSGSTPKKPFIWAKKRNNDQPSVADFCLLCKCSFKTVYGNFPPKSTSSELSKNPPSKASYISTENIFNTSCWNGKVSHQSDKCRACHWIHSKRTELITPIIWTWPARRPRPGKGKWWERSQVQKNV